MSSYSDDIKKALKPWNDREAALRQTAASRGDAPLPTDSHNILWDAARRRGYVTEREFGDAQEAYGFLFGGLD